MIIDEVVIAEIIVRYYRYKDIKYTLLTDPLQIYRYPYDNIEEYTYRGPNIKNRRAEYIFLFPKCEVLKKYIKFGYAYGESKYKTLYSHTFKLKSNYSLLRNGIRL